MGTGQWAGLPSLCSLSLCFGSSGCYCCDNPPRPSKQLSFYMFHPAFLSWGLAWVLVWYKLFNSRQRTWILSQLSSTTHGISRWLAGTRYGPHVSSVRSADSHAQRGLVLVWFLQSDSARTGGSERLCPILWAGPACRQHPGAEIMSLPPQPSP